jgi:hypothetical protein
LATAASAFATRRQQIGADKTAGNKKSRPKAAFLSSNRSPKAASD